jgi:hypothetical protein
MENKPVNLMVNVLVFSDARAAITAGDAGSIPAAAATCVSSSLIRNRRRVRAHEPVVVPGECAQLSRLLKQFHLQ